jgi:two-component sensor histidine kinase
MNSIVIKYKKLFIKGAYLVTIFISILAFFADFFLIDKKIDALIDLAFTIFTIVSYFFIFLKKDIKISSILLFWIAVSIEIIYFLTHSLDYKIILMILIPIIAIFVLPKKDTIINLILFYTIEILLFLYTYFFDKNNTLINNQTFLLSFLIANIFILTFGIFYYKTIDELIKELEESNRQKQFLLKEIHHRVKNNLNLISSILGLQLDKDDKFLKNNQQRISSIATLHEILYKQDYTNNNFKEYVKSLADKILNIYNKKVDFNIDISNLYLSIDSMVHLGILLNELITNSLKHNREPIKIDLSFKRLKEGFVLIYCDNSNIDLKKQKKGFGLFLVELAIKDLDGELEYIKKSSFNCLKIKLSNLKESFNND